MLGNFEYCNPTKLYFGDESLKYLNTELPKYGSRILLIYGGGSIKKTQAAHVVITFAQTDDQKTQGRMNIFLAKLRSGKITRNQFYNVAFNNGTCKFDMSNIDADTSAIDDSIEIERDREIAAMRAKEEAKNMLTK